VIEALFKNTILFIIILSCISFPDHINNFVFSNMLPLEISANSFGVRAMGDKEEIKTYFNYQTWVTRNLFMDAYVSPSFNNNIDITYGMNLGYSSIYDAKHFKNINYAVGYFRKKFSDNTSKWINLSIIPMFKVKNSWISLSFNYSFFNDGGNKINKRSLICNYIRKFKDNFILKTGMQFFEDEDEISIAHFIGLSYRL